MNDFPDRFSIATLQMALLGMGHNVGPIDGIMGGKTRAALRAVVNSFEPLPEKGNNNKKYLWPEETTKALDDFYGKRGDHSQMGLLKLPAPLRLYSPNGPLIDRLYAHKKIHNALYRCLEKINKLPSELINKHELQVTGGVYNDRLKRTGGAPSTHSWGCAIDLSPRLNSLGKTPDMPSEVVSLFKEEGAEWGGDWKSVKDGMHFQFCRSV